MEKDINKSLTEEISLKERLSTRLIKIAEDIPGVDRKEFLELHKGKINPGTLSKYLNGNVMDPETALGILLWFEAKKAARLRKMEASMNEIAGIPA